MAQLNDFMTRIDLSVLNDYVAANGKSVVYAKAVKNDSLIDMVVAYNYRPKELERRTCLSGKNAVPKYHVVSQYIDVERYYMDVDTTVFNPRYGFPNYYSELTDNEYRIDSIIPQLPTQKATDKELDWDYDREVSFDLDGASWKDIINSIRKLLEPNETDR